MSINISQRDRIESGSETGISVRPFVPADEEFVLSLAPRLVIGIASWRSQEAMLETTQRWLAGSIQRHGDDGVVFIAEDERGERLGVATVWHGSHFTGEPQAQ